jgi:hypothetical protein
MPKATEKDLRSYADASGAIIPHLSPWTHLTNVPTLSGHCGNGQAAACLDLCDCLWARVVDAHGVQTTVRPMVAGLKCPSAYAWQLSLASRDIPAAVQRACWYYNVGEAEEAIGYAS